VSRRGVTLGRIVSEERPDVDLSRHASWLAGWIVLRDQHHQLRMAALTDPLTGAWNRRYLDRFLEVADENLRFEDALLRVSGRRILVLLVATPPASAEEVVERLGNCFRERCERAGKPRWCVLPAVPAAEGSHWRTLFRAISRREEDAS